MVVINVSAVSSVSNMVILIGIVVVIEVVAFGQSSILATAFVFSKTKDSVYAHGVSLKDWFFRCSTSLSQSVYKRCGVSFSEDYRYFCRYVPFTL